MKRVLFAAGTRPEAIKLAPLVHELRRYPETFEVHLCSTGQQPDLLGPVWECFGLRPDSSLQVMRPGQSLASLSARLLEALPPVLEQFQPQLVAVQGDTATTLCAAQAAFYQRIPVGHVEAGLRTHDLSAPFPEELNRVLVSRIAALHFAPTEAAAENLRREGVPAAAIHVTGNTGIDALLRTLGELVAGRLEPRQRFPRGPLRRIVATMHRRESFGAGLASVCEALNRILARGDVELIVPLHPNPEARSLVEQLLRPHPHLRLCPPLDYVSFIALMREADLLLTDSGGIQEEAPYLGVPVAVLRECTERQEGVAAGLALVAGFDPAGIVSACEQAPRHGVSAPLGTDGHAIYGDGAASGRIRELIDSFLSK